MASTFGTDMTQGSVPRHLIAFSIPMLLGNLLQVGYSVINAIWVGNIIGKDAIGATAVSFPIILILIGIAGGASVASTILISQFYGAKNFKRVEQVVNNSFAIAMILGVLLTIIGVLFSDIFLRWMGAPSSILLLASNYLKITIGGFVLLYLNLLIAAILRGIGDTKTPLAFMAIGILINGVLDPLMIKGIWPFPNLGLNGAAVASLVAQSIALIISIVYLNKKNPAIALRFSKLSLDSDIVRMMMKLGLPSTIQQCMVSMAWAFITSFINSFGTAAINAYGAAARIDQIAFMPAISMSMAVSAMTGQHIGAKKLDRVKEIFHWAMLLSISITLFITVIGVFFSESILSAFGLHGTEMEIGVTYLHYVASCYVFFAVMFVSNGVINGAGQTVTTMIFSLFALWVVRIPVAAYLSRTSLGIKGIWIGISIGFFVVMVISLLYYYLGFWNKPLFKRKVKPDLPLQLDISA